LCFRDKADLPEELVFHVNYLGGEGGRSAGLSGASLTHAGLIMRALVSRR
jgi:glutamate/tyrosine decarboxylase-like PLP-dependent enzyme